MDDREKFANDLANLLGAKSTEIAEAKAEEFVERYEIDEQLCGTIKEIYQLAFIQGCKHGYAACLKSMKSIQKYVEGQDDVH